jgi:4'-phosphopantetheinyl transferase
VPLLIAVARIPDAPDGGEDVAPAWLGGFEQRRWRALPPAARREFVASRALLRRLLQDATGVAADAWDVSAQANSAPRAEAPRDGVAAGTVHASLSHRLGWVAAAVAGIPVGIDVECERPPRSEPRERAALMLSPSELAQWQALPADEREAALLTRWTLKEAWFKASPPEAAPWDFRRVVARPCAPAQANARAWTAPPLHVALSCDDADALAAAACLGLDDASARTSFWRVERAASAN